MKEPKTVRSLHHEAMAAYSQEDFATAARLEAEAARMIEPLPESEPTRGILFVSAASIALRVPDFALAESLAADGLKGFPQERDRKDLIFASSLAKLKHGGEWVKPVPAKLEDES